MQTAKEAYTQGGLHYELYQTHPKQVKQKINPTSKVSLRSQFYKVNLACGTTYQLQDIEAAGISYVPCAHIMNSPSSRLPTCGTVPYK